MTKTISNTDDVIDSRDVIARIKELEDERDGYVPDDAEEGQEEAREGEPSWADQWAEDNPYAEELKALLALQEEAEGYAPDWTYGATLIRESYFEDYAQELVEDCFGLPKDLPGFLVIDWEKTAENIKQDYTEVDFDGETYLVR